MSLTPKQRRHLRSLAHHLKPVAIIGDAGLTSSVINEIDRCLTRHELIKVKINNALKTKRKEIAEEICSQTGSAWVQDIGRISIVYRAKKDPVIRLP